MANEEAIKILKSLFEHCKGKNGCLGYIEHFFTKDEEEALDMVIKALEQQPCEDCISRQVVKDMLTAEWTKYMPMEMDINLSFVLDKISALPSVTPSYNSIKTELEPCEGCISREEAIRIAEQGQIQGYEWQFKKLCNLPSVTPKVEWIPVSERLPDKLNDVLITFYDCPNEYDVAYLRTTFNESYKKSGAKYEWVSSICRL